MLNGLGIESVQIEDDLPLSESDAARMFVDIPPVTGGGGFAYVTFYTGEDEDAGAVRERVREGLNLLRGVTDIGDGTVTESETADEDWANNWKRYFHKFTVRDVTVIPSWEKDESERNGNLTLYIDPGSAFGTGKHETTQLCMRSIRGNVSGGERMLDIGCGSGILGLLAVKSNARHVDFVDIDPAVRDAVAKNMAANGVSEDRYDVFICDMTDERAIPQEIAREKYDIVTANILAEVLLKLMPRASRLVKSGGLYITSGILNEKAKRIEEAMREAGFKDIKTETEGEWSRVTGRKI